MYEQNENINKEIDVTKPTEIQNLNNLMAELEN